jgi:predicted enzyme related to lactoylglutathione lyase
MTHAATVELNTPGWFDLATSDPEAARAFYTQLFGWTAEVVPDPQAGGYGFFRLGGRMVGGVGPLMNQSQPTSWSAYVLVADAAEAISRARASGGSALVEPMDVMGQGTMAFIADPSGAVMGLWQPALHRGVEVRDVPGSAAWTELHTRDLAAVGAFYSSVFGWEARDASTGGMPYTEWKRGDASVAGATPLQPGEESSPSYWLVYFAVADVDAASARAAELGGTVLLPATDFPGGRFSVVRDPQGAIFGMLLLRR